MDVRDQKRGRIPGNEAPEASGASIRIEGRTSRTTNVGPFTGRGRADDHSNHSQRSAAAVQCSGGLVGISAVRQGACVKAGAEWARPTVVAAQPTAQRRPN